MALAVSLFSLQSCEDVPAPYDIPGIGGGNGGDVPTEATEVSCAEAAELCNALEEGTNSVETYSITGYITDVFATVSKGQQSFWMADTKDGGKVIQAYWANLPEGVAAFKKGSKVKIVGKLLKYVNNGNVTPEVKNADVTILEDGIDVTSGEAKGTGVQNDPYNVAGVLKFIETLGADKESSDVVWIKGKVHENSTTDATISSYGNMTFTMVDEGFGATFTAFQVYGPGNKKFTSVDQIKAGDEVVVCGKVVNFKGNTPETVGKGAAYVYSINGKSEEQGGGDQPTTGDAKGTGTEADPFNVAGVIKYTSALAADVNSDKEVYFTGTVDSFKSGEEPGNSYGNATFYIKDESTTDKFYCFRIMNINGEKFTSADQLKVGQKVTVCGTVVNYKGNTPETVSGKARLVKVEGEGTSGGGQVATGNSITFSAMGYDNAQDFDGKSVTVGDAKITFSKGSGSTTPKYYNTGAAMRVYGGNTVTVSSSQAIASVEVKYGEDYNGTSYYPTSDATSVSAGTYNFSTHVWTINAKEATITRTATTGHWRIVSITINYASGAKKYVRRK